MDISKLSQEISSQFDKLYKLDNTNEAERKAKPVQREVIVPDDDKQDISQLQGIKEIVDNVSDVRANRVAEIKKALDEGFEFKGSDIAAAMMNSDELVEFLSS